MVTVFEAVSKLIERGEAGVLVTVVEAVGSVPAGAGAKLLVTSSGPVAGTVGGGPLESRAIEEAKRTLDTQKSSLLKYSLGERELVTADEAAASSDAEETGMMCGGHVTLFYEYLFSTDRVVIFGAGHVGKALVRHLVGMGRTVTVVDTREDVLRGIEGPGKVLLARYEQIPEKVKIPDDSFVVVCTNTHDSDLEVLKALYSLQARPAYIGALASSKKAETMKRLLSEYVGKEPDTDRLYMPVGLDIGGRSVDEIAISIIAEMQAVKHDKKKLCHMRDREKKE
ncbi:MAG: XdhC family protein [Spirochaetes bacterium]|nr:XdhC family protein [Spirochaetota bacterium]